MELTVWRHPRPFGVSGRCIGHADVAVDPRKAKRLAHRIRRHARRGGLRSRPGKPVVWTSPLARCRSVGRVLRGWGWVHRVDARLRELDFGDWDGRAWSDIPLGEIDAWCLDFPHARPGGGEAVLQLLARCRSFIDGSGLQRGGDEAPGGCLVVGHAGWINALRWIASAQPPHALPTASQWPAPLGYSKHAGFDTGRPPVRGD